MANVRIYDNGAAFMIDVDGISVHACSSLGEKCIPVVDWIDGMRKAGYLD